MEFSTITSNLNAEINELAARKTGISNELAELTNKFAEVDNQINQSKVALQAECCEIVVISFS